MRVLAWCFILFVAIASATASPPAKMPRIGIVGTNLKPGDLALSETAKATITGLQELGWVDGKNIQLIWRSAEGHHDRWPAIIDELLAIPVDVLVIYNARAVQAAMQKTRTVPIVCPSCNPDVLMRERLIVSLARPGGNLTGMTTDVSDGKSVGKTLGLLKAVAPRVTRVAVLIQAYDENNPGLKAAWLEAAKAIGVSIFPIVYRSGQELESAVASSVKQGADGLVVIRSSIAGSPLYIRKIPELAARHRLPAAYELSGAPDNGGLLSYSPNVVSDNFRRTGYFVDKILRGAKPGEMPFEQQSKMYLHVNLKAARALGLTIPQDILLQADRVID